MRRLLLLVPLALLGSAAHAAEWRVVAATDWPPKGDSSMIVEVDTASIRSRDGLRQAWTRYNYQPAKPGILGKVVGSAAALSFFDCKNEEHATSVYVEYTERYGAGETGFTQNAPRQEALKKMVSVVPGTFGETVLQYVCTYQLR